MCLSKARGEGLILWDLGARYSLAQTIDFSAEANGVERIDSRTRATVIGGVINAIGSERLPQPRL